MYELPPRLILDGILTIHLRISAKVRIDCSKQNPCHNAREKEDDDAGVADGEPVNIIICDRQVIIPSCCPTYIRFNPLNRVSVSDSQ